MSFIAEIRRRNVGRVGLAYGAVSWLLIQIVTSVEEPLGLPGWFDTAVIVLLGIGFPVALLLAWAFELTPQGIKLTESDVREAGSTRRTGQRLNYLTIGVLAVVVALLAIDRFTMNGRSQVMPNSIAVLPFDNLSPDRGDAYFAPGLYEEILNRLEKIPGLTVIARTTMNQFAKTDKSVPEIADELHVATVMDGSVRYANNVVRVSAQLIDPATESEIWSDTYERPFDDVFAIESDLAMNVANAMAVKFSKADQEAIEKRPTSSSEAYTLLLSASTKFDLGTPAGAAASLDQLDAATRLDPESANLWAAKASAATYATAFFPERTDELLTEAKNAADRALSIDASFAGAHTALAMVASARGQWSLADAEFRRTGKSIAVGSLEPFAAFSFMVGHIETGLGTITKVRERDPLNSNAWFWVVAANDALGDSSASRDAYDRGSQFFATWPVGRVQMLVTFLGDGQFDQAMNVAEGHIQDRVVDDVLMHRTESPASLNAELNRLYRDEPTVNPWYVAIFAAYFGDHDLALEASRDGIAKAPISAHYLWRPLFRELRQDPGFKTLLRDSGFVDYWRQDGWPDLCRPLGNDDFECS